MGFQVHNFTAISLAIFFSSIVIIGISIAEIALETRMLHAFHHIQIQLPGSSLAEWLFINMDPHNLDTGPTVAIITLGSIGIGFSSVLLIWCGCMWFGIRSVNSKEWLLTNLMVIFLQMTASVGILTYVFVAESSNKLPESFFDWRDVQFTREYWLCTAFPSKIQDPDRLYGFPACKLAQAGRFSIAGIACMSLVLVGLCVGHVVESEVFKSKGARLRDIEQMGHKYKTGRQKESNQRPIQPSMPGHILPQLSRPESTLERLADNRQPVREYYSKL